MSFSSEVKAELARLDTANMKKCDMLAEIAGFLRVSASLTLAGGGLLGIVAQTENPAVARRFKTLMKRYFKSNVTLGVGESHMPGTSRNKGRRKYYLNISPEEKSMQILRETGMMLIREGDDYFSDGIWPPVVRSKCCRKAYMRGMFLGCGTMSDPHRGYDLEFVIDKERTALDLRKLVGSFVDLSASMVRRGDNYIVYVKRMAYISDILALMGADSAVLELENIRIMKENKRETQRLVNFDHANVDRSVKVAEEQLEWIRRIIEAEVGHPVELADITGAEGCRAGAVLEGLRHLDPQLREIALLRLERPEANLTELGEALPSPVKKPAVSKRFARIRALADKLAVSPG